MSDTVTQVVPENGAGWVVMWHPGTPDHDDGTKATAEVTVEAFEQPGGWKDKGWTVVGAHPGDAPAKAQSTTSARPAPPTTTGGEA